MEAEPARETEGERALAADAAPPEGEPSPGMEVALEPGAEAASEPQMETKADSQPDAPPEPREELFAASGSDDMPDPLLDARADLSAERELARLAREPDTEPIPARPAYAVAAEPLHEAEPPDSWGAIDDPLAAQDAPEAGTPGEDAAVASASEEDPDAPELAIAEASAAAEPEAESVSLEVDTSTFEAEDIAATPVEPASPQWQPSSEDTAAAKAAAQREPTERFARQDAGWIGEALEGRTPLSPADLGTLASIGIEPSDGVGALRLLATLIRILNRSQLIEPDELRAEIRESREAAAAVAAQSPNGVESEGSSGGATEASESAAET